MKFAIDARFYGVTGIGRYLQNLIKELERIDDENEYTIFLRKEKMDEYQPQSANFKKVQADHPWYSFQEQLFFLKQLYGQKFDLVHFGHLNVPILYLRPFVVTIHDLITHQAKKGATTRNTFHFYFKKLVYKFVVWWTAKRAKAIIVPTNVVKEEVSAALHVSPDKIFVTYEAVDEMFLRKVNDGISDVHARKVLDLYGIVSPYLLYVSSFYPHKNHQALIDAFAALTEQNCTYNGKTLQLVLVGKQDTFAQTMQEYVHTLGIGKQVIFTGSIASNGYTPDEHLVPLLAGASVYVCPSKQEGFGITFLEAMALGIPTVLSNASCIPEIGGDAAVYFDPDNIDDLVNKIKWVLSDETIRKELTKKGRERVNQFSWRRMAEETREVYDAAVNETKRVN